MAFTKGILQGVRWPGWIFYQALPIKANERSIVSISMQDRLPDLLMPAMTYKAFPTTQLLC